MIDMAANFGTTVTKKYKKIALARAIWQRSNANDSHWVGLCCRTFWSITFTQINILQSSVHLKEIMVSKLITGILDNNSVKLDFNMLNLWNWTCTNNHISNYQPWWTVMVIPSNSEPVKDPDFFISYLRRTTKKL